MTESYKKAEKIKKQNLINNKIIDWIDVEKNIDKFIEKFLKENKNLDIQNIVINKIRKIILDSKNENLNLNQLICKISKESQQFKNTYTKIQKQVINTKSFSSIENKKNSKSLNFSQEEFDKLKKLVNDLKISKVTFTTISATAAVAAAGFYAAAIVSFGATIPWAVGCTTISVVSGGVAAGISIALVQYDEELTKWQKTGSSFSAIFNLGHIFYRILNPLLIGATATITATSWAFPAALALIPITASILSWINLYK